MECLWNPFTSFIEFAIPKYSGIHFLQLISNSNSLGIAAFGSTLGKMIWIWISPREHIMLNILFPPPS